LTHTGSCTISPR